MSRLIKILFIDDDENDYLFFQNALNKSTVEGISAKKLTALDYVKDGKTALEYLQRALTKKDLPDLIILDLIMPIMDGLEVLRQIKQDGSLTGIPVYLLTSSKSDERKQECKKLGCVGFFLKPLHILELKSIIEKILNCC
jgi:two-component system, response regulator